MKDKLVVQKDNELIRKSINQFSYKQNQLMCALLGKYVNTRDNYCIDTTISIDELRQTLELTDGKENFESIKKALNDFGRNGSVGIYDGSDPKNPKWIWRPYFSQITLQETSVIFEWNPEMKDDLIGLKSKYTAYLANDYLKLSSVYSQNLYEQMKSYERMPNRPQITFTIDDLHRIMQTQKIKTYKNFNQFKTRCIERAIDDINEKTDIFVEFETVKDKKDKRKAAGLSFAIRSKKEHFNYNGCWLSGEEINNIIYTHHAKHKIYELERIKKENKQYYTLLRKGNKSDYDIILNFIENDKKQKSAVSNDIPGDNLGMPEYPQTEDEAIKKREQFLNMLKE